LEKAQLVIKVHHPINKHMDNHASTEPNGKLNWIPMATAGCMDTKYYMATIAKPARAFL
jgi:hypothetical protein